jgi:hypothetical protein
MILHFTEYIKENNELSGYNSFIILLKMIEDLDITFIKHNEDYLNSEKYVLFYKSYEIKDKQELLSKLEFRSSLKLTYDNLKSLKDKKVSFFIGIYNKILEYGFYNYTDKSFIKIGEFTFSKNILNNISKFHSFLNIKQDLTPINISKISLLNQVKNDIKASFYKDKKSEIEIKNFDVLTVKFDINEIEYKKYQNILESYTNNKKWRDKIDAYFEIDNDDLIFYFKVKKPEQI